MTEYSLNIFSRCNDHLFHMFRIGEIIFHTHESMCALNDLKPVMEDFCIRDGGLIFEGHNLISHGGEI